MNVLKIGLKNGDTSTGVDFPNTNNGIATGLSRHQDVSVGVHTKSSYLRKTKTII